MSGKYQDGDMIVGFRFAWPMDSDIEPLRNGAGQTMIVDQMAISGPVYYWKPGKERAMGFAVCRGCRKMSGGGGLKPNRSDAVRNWAHQHRCESGARLDEQGHFDAVDYKKWVCG